MNRSEVNAQLRRAFGMYMLMREGQRLPNHCHVFKSEDIINRG